MTAIQEAKDLNKLLLKKLIGSSMTHELNIHQKKDVEKKKKEISYATNATSRDITRWIASYSKKILKGPKRVQY